MTETLNLKMDHVTLITPFHGWFDILGLGLATVNLFTKFEVSESIRYEDIKECRNVACSGLFGVPQSLEIALFDTTHMSFCHSPVVIMSIMSCSVSEI